MNIKDTFRITSRSLFVIVTDADYNDLIDIKCVWDHQREISFPVFSIEWVNLSNLSLPGIVLKYERVEDLTLLEKIAKGNIIVE